MVKVKDRVRPCYTIYRKMIPLQGITVPGNPLFQGREEREMVAGNFVYHSTGKMVRNSLLCITGETQDLFASHLSMILIHNSPGDFEKKYQLLVSLIAINREKR